MALAALFTKAPPATTAALAKAAPQAATLTIEPPMLVANFPAFEFIFSIPSLASSFIFTSPKSSNTFKGYTPPSSITEFIINLTSFNISSFVFLGFIFGFLKSS